MMMKRVGTRKDEDDERVGTRKDEDDENGSEKEKKEKVRSRRKIRMEGKEETGYSITFFFSSLLSKTWRTFIEYEGEKEVTEAE